jgi:photosystem II stability/assembly factor-like uncharacterized protein
MKSSLVLVSLLVFCAPAVAQWNVLSNVPSPQTSFGVITYRDGVLWAGSSDVYKSTDMGKTWTLSYQLGRNVYGMDFFDRNNGAVSSDQGVFLTSDGGVTWRIQSGVPALVVSVRFGARVTDIFAGTEGSAFFVTNDGGATWTRHSAMSWTQDFATPADQATIAFESAPPTIGWIYRSTDRGATWTQLAGVTDGDCWSIATSTCDSEAYYIVNEELGGAGQQNSRFWVSTDHGSTWKATLNLITQDLLGAIAATANCVFLPTKTKGVLRSTDFGETWATIGGPTVTFDSRRITAVNANELFVYGESGDIYHTTNSGGSPVLGGGPGGTFAIVPSSVVYSDSVGCDETAESRLSILRACSSLAVKSYQLTGTDASYFSAQDGTSADTIVISFRPDAGRSYSGTLHVVLSNDSVIDIPLQGNGKLVGVMTFTSLNIANDTIGAFVELPIILHSNVKPQSVDFGITYDSSSLLYSGTYNHGGVERTVTEQPGIKVHFDITDIDASDTILGYARFQSFPTSTGCLSVTFDSIAFGSNGRCPLVRLPDASAKICATANCANPLIAQWLRYGQIPRFWIVPNPATESAVIVSNLPNGTFSADVFDALGHKLPVRVASNDAGHPKLDLSTLRDGVYTVLATYGGQQTPLKLLILR